MRLDDRDCEDHENPDPANRTSELGVFQSTLSGREWLYVYLMWDETSDGKPEISACILLEFSSKRERNDYGEKLLRNNHSVRPGDEVGLSPAVRHEFRHS